MRKLSLVMVAVVALVVLSSAAMADYYNPPDWRGGSNFTHQEWDFTTDARSSPPEVDENPYGTPIFSIAGATWFPSAAPFIPGSTREGLWAGSGSGSATVTLFIPNREDVTRTKLVWLQVAIGSTNINGLNMNVGLVPNDGQSVHVLNERLYAMPSGEQYGYYYEKLWSIDWQPGFETITANINFSGVWGHDILAIDEIDVDTVCVPEPMSIMLGIMGLGSVAGFKRLRRK